MATKIAFGPFVLDVDRGTLVREGRPIALSSKGLQLLLTLLREPGQVLRKADLIQAAW
jgi:DNA-binding winged-HTH domains